MPNRILKESICRSESIDELSWFEEVLFYRLIVVCDDFGRYDGRPKIIKGSCFPLKDVTQQDIADALIKLSAVGLVRGYEVQGRPYLQLTTWDCHQQVRAKKSKYPSMDETCNQLISNDCNSPRNPIQSESYSNTITRASDCRFMEFAKAYPKQGADNYAVGVEYINTLRTGAVTEDDLIQSAKNYAEACRINETPDRYIQNAENFLKKLTFDAYLPGKYKKPAPKKKTQVDQYNEFMKSEIDMDALEKSLLGGGENGC